MIVFIHLYRLEIMPNKILYPILSHELIGESIHPFSGKTNLSCEDWNFSNLINKEKNKEEELFQQDSFWKVEIDYQIYNYFYYL